MNRQGSRYDRKFARIAKRLQNYPRGRSSQEEEWDLFEDLDKSRSSRLFLGVYGDLALQYLLKEFNFYDALAGKGIHHPVIKLGLDDPYRHIFRLYDGEANPSTMVAELVFRRLYRHNLVDSHTEPGLPCLYLEWILLQNPHGQFDRRRLRLPDQDNPGLGLGTMVLSLIAQMAGNLGMDGILTVPTDIHSALFFSQRYVSISPAVQAGLAGLKKAAGKYGFAELVWAERWNDLFDKETQQPYHWEPSEMIHPLSDELVRRFMKDGPYREQVAALRKRFFMREGVRYRYHKAGKLVRSERGLER